MNQLSKKRVFLAEDVFLAEELIVVKMENAYTYENGKRTEKIEGKWLEVVDTERFEKYRIKMPLEFKIEERSQINIADFVGFAGKLYIRNNQILWSLKAYGIS